MTSPDAGARWDRDADRGTELRVDIRAFEGVALRAAHVVRRRERPADLHAPTALIVGSAIELTGRGLPIGSETMKSLIGSLTPALASHGLNLVTCSAPGVQNYVSKAYVAEAGRGEIIDLVVTRNPECSNAFGAHAPNGFTCHGDVSLYCGMPFEFVGCLAAQICDVVIVVSGGLGSVIEISIAAMRECSIITLVDTGGAAEMIAPMLSRFKASNRGLHVREVRGMDEFRMELDVVVRSFRANGAKTKLAPLWTELNAGFESRQAC